MNDSPEVMILQNRSVSMEFNSPGIRSDCPQPSTKLGESQSFLISPDPTNRLSEFSANDRMCNVSMRLGDGRRDVYKSQQFPSNVTSRTSKLAPDRKNPEREFFELTVLSYQLKNQEACPSLMLVDRSALYKECKKIDKPFQFWPEWIEQEMTKRMLNDIYNSRPQEDLRASTISIRSTRSSKRTKSPHKLLSENERKEHVDKQIRVKQQRSTVITSFDMRENYFQPRMDIIEESRHER